MVEIHGKKEPGYSGYGPGPAADTAETRAVSLLHDPAVWAEAFWISVSHLGKKEVELDN